MFEGKWDTDGCEASPNEATGWGHVHDETSLAHGDGDGNGMDHVDLWT